MFRAGWGGGRHRGRMPSTTLSLPSSAADRAATSASSGSTPTPTRHGRPLDRPAAHEREVAAWLAAAGHSLPIGVLADVVGGVDTIEAAEDEGLVEVDDEGRVSLAPDTEVPTLGWVRRARMRGELGRALSTSSAVDRVIVAGHLLAGATIEIRPDVMRRVLDVVTDLAGDDRVDEAALLVEQVLGLLDGAGVHGNLDVELHVRALVSRADLAARTGRASTAASARAAALALARAHDEARTLATALLSCEGPLPGVDDDPALLAEIDECVTTLEAFDDARSRRLTACLCALRAERCLVTDPVTARAWSSRSVELARATGEADVLARCLTAHRVTSWHPMRQAMAAELTAEMIAIGPRTRHYRELGSIAALQTCLELGDLAGFDVGIDRLRRRVDVAGTSIERCWLEVLSGARAATKGAWDDVAVHVRAARTLRGADPVLTDMVRAQEVLVAWQQGIDPPALVATPAAVDVDPVGWGPLRSSWRACLLGLTAPVLERDRLEHDLSRLLARGVEGLHDDLTWGPVVACASMAAVVARSTVHARMLADAIEPVADQWAATAGAVSFGPFRWHLGRLLGVLGEHDRAREHLLEVIAECDAVDAAPWAARAHLAIATIDPVGGRAHAEMARIVAERLQMRRVHELALHAQGVEVEAPRPHGLTRREVEVLGHVARGCTNRDIASEMFLSVKTVERHLLNAYLKVGLRNRSEATAFVLRHGLAG